MAVDQLREFDWRQYTEIPEILGTSTSIGVNPGLVETIDEYCRFGPCFDFEDEELFPIEWNLARKPLFRVDGVPYRRDYLSERFPDSLQSVTRERVHVALLAHGEYEPEENGYCTLASTEEQPMRNALTYVVLRNAANIQKYLNALIYMAERIKSQLPDALAKQNLSKKIMHLSNEINAGQSGHEALSDIKVMFQVWSGTLSESDIWLNLLIELVIRFLDTVDEQEKALIEYSRGTWVFLRDSMLIHGRLPLDSAPSGGDLSYFSFRPKHVLETP